MAFVVWDAEQVPDTLPAGCRWVVMPEGGLLPRGHRVIYQVGPRARLIVRSDGMRYMTLVTRPLPSAEWWGRYCDWQRWQRVSGPARSSENASKNSGIGRPTSPAHRG